MKIKIQVNTDFGAGPFGANYPHARMWASSTMVSQDELLIHGGCLSGGMSGGPCPSHDSWLYSYTRNSWQQVDASAISLRSHSAMAALIPDGNRRGAIMFSGLQNDANIIKVEYQRVLL